MRAFFLSFVVAVTVLLAGCRTVRPEPGRLASKEEGTLRSAPEGAVVGGPGLGASWAWLGIAYAKAPVGELRWRAPQKREAFNGVFEATAFGRPCTQLASALIGIDDPEKGEVAGSEDCLTLNVWAPRDLKDGERLPVMFWIHGGGNSVGSAQLYDGGILASKQRVVVVSAQYRLGPFGWLRHRGLRATATDAQEQSGNFATLDLIAALQWVHDNVDSFGGDANNVTVFGESAGAFNTFTLLLAPGAKGLFHKAISQSGGLPRATTAEAEHFVDEAERGHQNSSNELIARILVAKAAAKDRAEAVAKVRAMSDAEAGRFLRGLSAQELFAAYGETRGLGMLDAPLIFPDGVVLPEGDWLSRFADASTWNKVPVILGSNKDELKLFLFLDQKRITRRFWLLPRFVDEPSYHVISAALSDAWKLSGVDGPAAAMRRGGHDEVYAYRWDWDEEPTKLGAELSRMLGAAHGLEIPFVFGRFELGQLNILFTEENRAGREALSDAMMTYWANFARTGAPSPSGGGGSAPHWERWRDGQFVVLDTQAGGGIRMSRETQSWEEIAAYVKGAEAIAATREKCLLLHAAAGWDHGAKKERYAAMGEGLCSAFPFDGHPWGEDP